MCVRFKSTWACALACAGLAVFGTTLAVADTDVAPPDGNPYSVISDRNVFHLNPPPPPPVAEAPKPLDLPTVMLTGIVGKGKSMKVLLALRSKETKGDAYLTLAPDEMQKNVKLVSIRLDKREVDIINQGTPQTLSAKSNNYASSTPAAQPGRAGPGLPAGIQGLHHPPGAAQPAPPPMPAAAAYGGGGSSVIAGGGANDGGLSSILGGARSGGPIISGGNAFTPAPAAVQPNNATAQIANGLFNQNSGTYQMPTLPTAPVTPEVQAAGLILQKQMMQQLPHGGPPLPPSVQEALDGLNGAPPTPP